MTYDEKERLINIISWGKILFNNSLILRNPSSEESAKASYLYRAEYNRGRELGLLPENGVLNNMIQMGQWSFEDENQIDGLKKDIYNIRRGLLDLMFNITKLEHARSLLRSAEKTLIEKLIRRKGILGSSVEAHALLQFQRCIIRHVAENNNGEPLWVNQEDFDNFYNLALINNLRQEYFERSKIDLFTLRELARSEPWRSRWETAKNTSQLFKNLINEWSYNQQELVKWSIIYDSVYSSINRPSQEVIEDDDLLDSWLIRQNDKGDNIDTKIKNKGRQEKFIFADKDGAKRVYKMNDPNSRAKILARQKVLNKHGVVNDQNLPDSRADIKNIAMEISKSKIKDIRKR